MENNFQVFNNEEFGNVRVVNVNGEGWFVGKDITDILEYQNGSRDINRHVDEEDRITVTVFDGSQNRNTTVINESGLYSLVLKSKKDSAKKFKRWVTCDVLPSIRKTGGYIANDDLFINTYLPHADQETVLMFRTTLQTVRKQNEVIQQQQKEIESANKEITHKEDVIIGLVKDISLAEKRQRISQIIRYRAGNKYSERYSLLYSEFDKKYHIDTKRRLENSKSNGTVKKSVNRMEYICDNMGMTSELYEVAAKVFENDLEELMKELKNTASREQ